MTTFKSKFIKTLFALSLLLVPGLAANAQKLESVHKDWTVLSTIIDSDNVCYIASLPTKQEGNFGERQDTYLLVNLFPERKPEVSFSPGFALNTNKSVKFTVGDTEYNLAKIKENIAWTQTVKEDDALISAMKKGVSLHIRSEGENGNYAIDTYSLNGFTASYDEMVEICSKSAEDAAKEIAPQAEKKEAESVKTVN